MNLKVKNIQITPATGKLSFSGSGKVSVSVNSIVNSPKVQRQVDSVRAIAESQATAKSK
jgi:hypothetical protein